MRMLLLDTSAICAAVNSVDPWHQATKSFLENNSDPVIAPISMIPEACYMLNKYLGQPAENQFITLCVEGELRVENLAKEDLHRSLQVMEQFSKANIGFVDASLVAVAERLNITRILTLDRRHFSLFRPRHCSSFTLLP